MMEKPEENQNVIQHSELIVVSLSYSRKLIFEIPDGFKMLELMAKSIEIEETFGQPLKLKKGKRDDINISFITRQRLREMLLESIVEPEVKP